MTKAEIKYDKTVHDRCSRRNLLDLHSKLQSVWWPDELDGAGWEFGTDLSFMRRFHSYWTQHYNWRDQERALNQLQHFKYSSADGLKIHFIHEKGRGPNLLPLVLTHGWPGGFVEMTKIIPLLADPEAYGADPRDSFSVVVPSIPGYGFSDRPASLGTGIFRVASLWAELMERLGYERFGAQGGDCTSPSGTSVKSKT